MFLEKHSRFFRRYEVSFGPRHTRAPRLKLFGASNEFSVLDALEKRIEEDKAKDAQPNGDTVDLIKVKRYPELRAVVLLFHRGSPNAADPTYRRKARGNGEEKFTLRQAQKQQGEEQSTSAHFVIFEKEVSAGVYSGALEEIPGLSLSVILPILKSALRDYRYDFQDAKRQKDETYTVLGAVGIKSETLSAALKDGHLRSVTLSKPARPDFVDEEGIFEPTRETMKIKVIGAITEINWKEKVRSLIRRAKAQGWEDFNIDIDFDDKRARTVRIDRENESKEILFVRAEELQFKSELKPCTNEIILEIVQKAVSLANSPRPA